MALRNAHPDPRPLLPARLDLPGAALFAAALLYLRPLARYGVNWIDEGFALNAAQRIHEGEVLYRDFFAPYGPGRHYLLAWSFDLFGSRLIVARSLWIVCLGATAVLVYRVGLRLLPRWAALAAAACFLLAPPQAFKVFTAASYLAIALAMIRAADGPSLRRWAFAGVVVGACGLFRFELWGVGMLLAAGTWWLGARGEGNRRRAAELAAVAGGAAIAVGPTLLAYGSAGLLPGIVHYERMQKAQLARFFTLPLPSPFRALGTPGGAAERAAALFDALAAWAPAGLTLAALALVALRARRGRRRPEDTALLVLGLAGVLMQVAYLSRPDFDHLLHVTPVAFLILFHLLGNAWTAAGGASRRRAGWMRAGAACGAIFLAGFLASAIFRHPAEGFSIGRLRANTEWIDFGPGGRAAYYDTPYQASVTRGIQAFTESVRDEMGPARDRIAFLKFGGFWYYVLELRSPISQEPLSSFSGGGGHTPDEEKVIAALRRARLRYVLLDEADPRFSVVPPFDVIHPAIATFLDEEFRPTPLRFGEWTVLTRISTGD